MKSHFKTSLFLISSIILTACGGGSGSGTTPQQPTNSAPIVANPIADMSANVGDNFSFTIPTNVCTDADNDPITISTSIDPNILGLSVANNIVSGTLTTQGSVGVDVTCSATGGSVVDTFGITVGVAGNSAPIINSAVLTDQTGTINVPFSYTVPNNFCTDTDGDTLTTRSEIASTDNQGLTASGLTISGTPVRTGNLIINVFCSDGVNNEIGTSYNINILTSDGQSNQAPIIQEDPNSAISVDEDSSVTFTLTGLDLDGSIASIEAVSQPVNGTLTGLPISGVLANVSYTPSANFSGTDSFQFTVTDNDGVSSIPFTYNIIVSPTNDPTVFTSANTAIAPANNITAFYTAIATDIDGDTIIYGIDTGGDASFFNIDSNTGELSFNVSVSVENPLDANGDNIYIAIISINSFGETGSSELFSETVLVTVVNNVGTGDTLNFPQGIVLNVATNQLLVANRANGDIIGVNLTTGNRSAISDFNTGTGTNFGEPVDIALDTINNQLFVVDAGFRTTGIIAVDLATGNRTVISDSNTGGGVNFLTPSGIVLDATNDRLLVTNSDDDSIIAVNLTTGNRTIISDNNIGIGATLDNPQGIELDFGSNRLLVSERFGGEITGIDLTTGNRTIISDINLAIIIRNNYAA